LTVELHSLTLSWADGFRFRLECGDGIAAAPVQDALNVDGYSMAEKSGSVKAGTVPALSFQSDPSGLYESIRLRENATYIVTVEVPKAEQVVRAMHQTEPLWPFTSGRLTQALQWLPSELWKTRPESTTLAARLNFRSSVGTTDLSIPGHEIRAEIACNKIDYFNEFRTLVEEVGDEVTSLIAQIDTASGLKFASGDPGDIDTPTLLFNLRRIMAPDELPAAMESIQRRPHSLVARERDVVPLAQTKGLDEADLARSAGLTELQIAGPLSRLFRGYSPVEVPELHVVETIDTPENRFVKDFLEDLEITLELLHTRLLKGGRHVAAREVSYWSSAVGDWLAWHPWAEVGSLKILPANSQVLQRRGDYRVVLDASLRIEEDLHLPWERGREFSNTLGEIRPIFELYEYWCFFKVREILRHLCGTEDLNSSSVYVKSADGLELTLRRGQTSRLDFHRRPPGGDTSVRLYYNRTFAGFREDKDYGDGSYSILLHPDFSVRISRGELSHWLHFDAKYRIDLAEWEKQSATKLLEQVESELEDGGTDIDLYQHSDLLKAHAYRDALLGTRGVYILFPGSGENSDVFVRQRLADYRKVFSVPGVGAFAMRPGVGNDQGSELETFLEALLVIIEEESSSYHEETGFSTL
jgi:predicted component of viral defense system (DUF524 family)